MLISCGKLHQARLLGEKIIYLIFGSVLNVSIFVLSSKKLFITKTQASYEQS